MSTVAPLFSMTMSSSALARSVSNLYWKPEQPPPSTLTRSMVPAGSPRRISPIRRAARSVTVTLAVIYSLNRTRHDCKAGTTIVKCGASEGQLPVEAERPMNLAISRAPYACDSEGSRGRLHAEPASKSRSAFRRDCDRVIHATAFRRLKHKTQVFVFDEGDHYRTRL